MQDENHLSTALNIPVVTKMADEIVVKMLKNLDNLCKTTRP